MVSFQAPYESICHLTGQNWIFSIRFLGLEDEAKCSVGIVSLNKTMSKQGAVLNTGESIKMMKVCGKMPSEARLEKIGMHQSMKGQFTIKYRIF